MQPSPSHFHIITDADLFKLECFMLGLGATQEMIDRVAKMYFLPLKGMDGMETFKIEIKRV
jgi:hypothetical protein